MPVDFNSLVDDNGTGTTGTILDKAEMGTLLVGTVVPDTNTGTIHNWPPTLTPPRTLIEWSGAADFTCTGLAGGVAGYLVTVKNTGTKVATFAHASASSSAANRFTNVVTSGPTPIAPGGWVTYHHDGTNWKLVGHEQGAWITPTFAAGVYTATTGTWTVDAGDESAHAYYVKGKVVFVVGYIVTSSVSATPASLLVTLPNGYTIHGGISSVLPAVLASNGTNESGIVTLSPGVSYLAFARTAGAFVVTTNTTYLYYSVAVPIT